MPEYFFEKSVSTMLTSEGYYYKSTPTIMLKGQWLKELGFEYGTPICIECSGGKLVITRADEIEATFTEIGMDSVMCVAEGT